MSDEYCAQKKQLQSKILLLKAIAPCGIKYSQCTHTFAAYKFLKVPLLAPHSHIHDVINKLFPSNRYKCSRFNSVGQYR
ncbi:conserved hypothetical protein [Ricinus communis]|uniref:Uncharacterized protein n=1 Tax=Ricinus communis TaxID=3988 RepID=B9SBH3_RICCO|nr:conserved hypothetical protein [Ricinus communis]